MDGDELSYCTNGRCTVCSGTDSPILTEARQCPGWKNGALQSASPGIYRQCTAQGTLTTTGTLDYSLGLSSPSSTPTRSLPAGASASRTPSGSRSATPSLSFGASPSTTPSLGSNGGQTTNSGGSSSSAANLPLDNKLFCAVLGAVIAFIGLV